MNTLRKITNFFIVFSLLFALLAFSARPAQAADCTKWHVVKKGEYLVKIAGYYGVTWRYLAEINHLANPSKIYPGQWLCVSQEGDKYTPPPPTAIPTFSIVSVIEDEDVTIRTYNFPAHDTFVVRMGAYGTKGVGGIKVDKIESGKGGSFTKTFDIPAELHGDYRIAIRLESPTSGHFAYNWFYNNTADGKPSKPPKPPYTGIPTFKILSVVEDKTVTIKTANFPADMNFTVRMGPYGTAAIGGYYVDTINSGDGGTFQATFDIPAALKGSYRIAIRMDSTSSGHYSYNWFYNNTAVDP